MNGASEASDNERGIAGVDRPRNFAWAQAKRASKNCRSNWRKMVFANYFCINKRNQRFKELERQIEGINTRMLVKELKQLEGNGIVTRKVCAQVPPKVEYSLTEKGIALKKVLIEMKNWGDQFI